MSIPPCPVSRCTGCRLLLRLCVCASAPALPALSARYLLLLHVKERQRSSNTGPLLRLSCPKLEIHIHGREGEPSDARAWVDEDRHRPVVLFPDAGAVPLTRALATADARPLALIIPDGTWGQASHMVRRVGGLAAWPHVTVPEAAALMVRPRRELSPDRMSTYEAVAQAIGVIEGAPAAAQAMQAFFVLFAARAMEMRGILPRDAPSDA